MTTLKTPEEASKCFRTVVDKARARIMVTEDRQAIATLLCELLEGERRELRPSEWILGQEIPDFRYIGFNDGLTKAQAIIRQTLEGKQE